MLGKSSFDNRSPTADKRTVTEWPLFRLPDRLELTAEAGERAMPAATRLDAPGRVWMNPSAANCSYTAETVVRESPRSSAQARVDASALPAA